MQRRNSKKESFALAGFCESEAIHRDKQKILYKNKNRGAERKEKGNYGKNLW